LVWLPDGGVTVVPPVPLVGGVAVTVVPPVPLVGGVVVGGAVVAPPVPAVGDVVVGGVVVVPPVPADAGGGVVVVGGAVVVVGALEPSAPAPADSDPPVPGTPASDDGAPEPEMPPFEEAGSVALPAEPPVPLPDVLPDELTAARGSVVGSTPPSSCEPAEPAPDAQLIVKDVASGSSAAKERERTLLCFDFARDMSSGTGGDRTSDVCAERAPQARTSLRSDEPQKRSPSLAI
jgi:hypothetical protein